MKFAERLKFIATGTSAATITLSAAVAGFRTLAQAIADGVLAVGDTGVPFTIDDGAGNKETSLFTITSATVLTRTSVLSSSAGGTTAATFTGATLSAFSSMPASFASKLPAVEVDGPTPNFVMATAAPNNADGRPNNTVYFQTVLSNGVIAMFMKIGGVYQPLGSATPAAGGSTPATAQMVIFAGQSQANSAGNTTAQTVPAAIAGPMPDVYIWNPYTKAWLTYEAGVNSAVQQTDPVQKGYWGAEAEYARRWKIDNPGVPLYIIKAAINTSCLQPEARSANRGCWDPTLPADVYVMATGWIADAKANLISAGKSINIRAWNWTHGENDSSVSTAVSTSYGAALTAFIAALRNSGTIGATTPFIISRLQPTWPFPVQLRAQQQLVAETVPYCRWFSADSVALDGADNQHYGATGVVTHGGLMYDEGLSGAETAKLYASRMTVAPSADRIAKLGTFFDALISSGVWSGISTMQIYASPTEQAARIDAKSGLVTAVNSGMTFTPDQGFTGTSTTSFINTGVNPATGDSKLERGNVSYAYYVRGNIADTGVDVGYHSNPAGRGVTLGSTQSPGSGSFRVNNANNGADNTYAGVSDVSGLWSASRKAVNMCTFFHRGTQIHTTDTVNTDQGESSNLIFVGNRNSSNNTSATNGTLRQYGMFIAGSGRTPAQEVALNNAVTAYLTSIGAN